MFYPSERRRHSRTATPHHPSALTTRGQVVHVLDLSASGVRIKHDMHMEPGAECELAFPVSEGVLDRQGKIVWCKPAVGRGTSGYESGVAFSLRRV